MATIIPTAPQRRSRKKPFIIIAIVIVVLGVAGVGFAFTPVGSKFYSGVADTVSGWFGKKKEPEPTEQKDEPASETDTNKLYAAASDDIQAGKPKEAEQAYQTEIDSKESPEEKAKLYMELSGALLAEGGSKQLAAALKYAQQAEKLYPTPQSAAQLMQVYEAQGNTDQAKKYQKLIQERDTSEWKDR